MRGRKGYTLVELLVAMAIFVIAIALIYGIFIAAKRIQSRQDQFVDLAGESRGGLEEMVRELRMAGAMTNTAQPCTDASGKTMLIQASPQAVEFEGDVNVDGKLERVRYFYDPVMQTLNRWIYTVDPAVWNAPARCGQSLTDPAIEPLIPAANKQVIAYGISNFSLQYFNDSGGPETNLSAISRISLTVTAQGNQMVGKDGSGNPIYQSRTATMDIKLPNLGTTTPAGGGLQAQAPAGVTSVWLEDRHVCGYLGVHWTANTESDLAGYIVWVKSQIYNATTNTYSWPSDWSIRKTVGVQTYAEFSAADGIVNGGTYEAMVQAFNSSAMAGPLSAVSNSITISDTIAPNMVGNMNATANGVTNAITLTWAQGSDTDTSGKTSDSMNNPYQVSYTVQRSSDGTNWVTLGNYSPITNTTINDIVPAKCQPYYYRINTIDACGLQSGYTAKYGDNQHTMVQATTIDPPNFFASGAGTTVTGNTTNRYARFSGTTWSDPSNEDVVIEEKNSPNSCPSAFASYNDSGASQLSSGLALNPNDPIQNNVSFTGDWNGFNKQKTYRFAAFTQSQCTDSKGNSMYSAPVDSGYCVTSCEDSKTYPLNTGINDCIFNMGDPINGLVCDKVELFWTTEDSNGNPPANCTAWGSGPNNDFYPEQGDGGYMIFRGVDNTAPSPSIDTGYAFQQVGPDPVTGPLQPFYFIDPYYDQTITSCQNVASQNVTYYRDRCSYRYKAVTVDCAMNQTNTPAIQQDSPFSPGYINSPVSDPSYPVRVKGPHKNLVYFYIENTAAAQQMLDKMQISWSNPSAYLYRVDICNSEPTLSSTQCTNWQNLWAASSCSAAVANGTLVDFTGANVAYRTLAASPVLGSGNSIKARMRLMFINTSTCSGTQMDLNNDSISIVPYYENSTSTTTSKMCPPSGWVAKYFALGTIQPPIIPYVYQYPPEVNNTDMFTDSDPSITATPPAGYFRSAAYDSTDYPYFLDNVGVAVKTGVTPNVTGPYSVPQCGVTNTSPYTGVLLYYTLTDNTVTSAPQPVNANATDPLLTPANYTIVPMCNQGGGACSSGTCIYTNPNPIPATDGQRVWYYVLAVDNQGNYNIAPSQSGNNFTAYTYDTREMNYHYIWVNNVSYNTSSNQIAIGNIWINRIKNALGQDLADTGTGGTAGSTLNIEVDGYSAADVNTPVSEADAVTTVSGCPQCWHSESGYGSFTTGAANQFVAPTSTNPVTITITAGPYTNSYRSFPSKTCKYSYDGSSVTNISGDPECLH